MLAAACCTGSFIRIVDGLVTSTQPKSVEACKRWRPPVKVPRRLKQRCDVRRSFTPASLLRTLLLIRLLKLCCSCSAYSRVLPMGSRRLSAAFHGSGPHVV